MNPSFETHLLCLEHGVWYSREDPSICAECEREKFVKIMTIYWRKKSE